MRPVTSAGSWQLPRERAPKQRAFRGAHTIFGSAAFAAGHGGRRRGTMERRAAITGLVVSLTATAVLGLLAGLIWGQVAPRAQLQEVSAGVAQVVNAETRAFIGADGWFCVIAA